MVNKDLNYNIIFYVPKYLAYKGGNLLLKQSRKSRLSRNFRDPPESRFVFPVHGNTARLKALVPLYVLLMPTQRMVLERALQRG